MKNLKTILCITFVIINIFTICNSTLAQSQPNKTVEGDVSTTPEIKCTSGGNGSVRGTSCSVTCESGYYACCNAMHNSCTCKSGGKSE